MINYYRLESCKKIKKGGLVIGDADLRAEEKYVPVDYDKVRLAQVLLHLSHLFSDFLSL